MVGVLEHFTTRVTGNLEPWIPKKGTGTILQKQVGTRDAIAGNRCNTSKPGSYRGTRDAIAGNRCIIMGSKEQLATLGSSHVICSLCSGMAEMRKYWAEDDDG